MAQHQYIRNISADTLHFPTLVPPLVLEPDAIAGIPTGIGVPFGTEPAKAGDHKGDGKLTVHDLPGDPAEVEPDIWHGAEAEVTDPLADLNAQAETDPTPPDA